MHKSIYLLSLGNFVLGFDAFVVAGLLPQISSAFDISIALAGMSVAIFTLSYALSAPVFATVLAGHSARLVLSAALSIFIAANVLSAMAPSFSILLISRAIAGAGAGLYAPFAGSSVAFLVDAARKGRALSFILGGMCLGTVLGVPIGLLVAEHLGWQWTFWTVAGFGVIALLGILSFFPAVRPPVPPSLGQRLSLLHDRRIVGIVGVTLLVSIASLGLYTYVTAMLAEAGMASSLPFYLWAWGLGGIFGSFSIGHVLDRSRRPRFVIVRVAALLAIVFGVMPLVMPLNWVGLAAFFAWGLLGWSTQAPQQHALLEIHRDTGAAAVALNSSANYLGSSLGAFFGGFLINAGTSAYYLPFIAAAVAAVGALIAMFFAQRTAGAQVFETPRP